MIRDTFRKLHFRGEKGLLPYTGKPVGFGKCTEISSVGFSDRSEVPVSCRYAYQKASWLVPVELDRFIAAAEQRLGRDGVAAAYAAFTKGAPI